MVPKITSCLFSEKKLKTDTFGAASNQLMTSAAAKLTGSAADAKISGNSSDKFVKPEPGAAGLDPMTAASSLYNSHFGA